MEDSNTIAWLSPAMSEDDDKNGRSWEAIRMNILQDIPRQGEKKSDLRSRESTDPLEDNKPVDILYPRLQLAFNSGLKCGHGLMFGTDPNCCDVVLPRLRFISNRHCYLTFDAERRLILRDCSTYGTIVKYDKQGRKLRRHFTWILGGHEAVVCKALHDVLQFVLLLEAYYKQKPRTDPDSDNFTDKGDSDSNLQSVPNTSLPLKITSIMDLQPQKACRRALRIKEIMINVIAYVAPADLPSLHDAFGTFTVHEARYHRCDPRIYLLELTDKPDKLLKIMRMTHTSITGTKAARYLYGDICSDETPWTFECGSGCIGMSNFTSMLLSLGAVWNLSPTTTNSHDTAEFWGRTIEGHIQSQKIIARWWPCDNSEGTVFRQVLKASHSISQCFITGFCAVSLYHKISLKYQTILWKNNQIIEKDAMVPLLYREKGVSLISYNIGTIGAQERLCKALNYDIWSKVFNPPLLRTIGDDGCLIVDFKVYHTNMSQLEVLEHEKSMEYIRSVDWEETPSGTRLDGDANGLPKNTCSLRKSRLWTDKYDPLGLESTLSMIRKALQKNDTDDFRLLDFTHSYSSKTSSQALDVSEKGFRLFHYLDEAREGPERWKYLPWMTFPKHLTGTRVIVDCRQRIKTTFPVV